MKKFILLFLFSFISLYSQIQVGDVKQFWSVTYIDWDSDTPQRSFNATCKKVSEHCYLFIENSVTSQPSQQAIDDVVAKFENTFVPLQTALYGAIPDTLDNDPRIYLMGVTNEWWGGYFDPGQQLPDTMVFNRWGKHSSEKEIIFFEAGYLSDSYVYEVISHEFGHLLHWGQDHSPEPINNPIIYWEDAWIDEQFSTFSPILTLEGLENNDIYDYAFFTTNPNKSLIYFSDYNQVKLFMLFMYEHFGDTSYIKTLIKEQANGILGINKTLNKLGYSANFKDVFNQWVVANYLDDLNFMEGKYGYKHYNFGQAQVSAAYTSYPINKKNTSLVSFGARYFKFSASSAKPVTFKFDGVDNSLFRISLILKNNSSIVNVIDVPLDSLQYGTFYAEKFGVDYNTIIMAAMNVDSLLAENQTASFSYEVIDGINSVEDVSVSPNLFSISECYPNPFNPSTSLNYSLSEDGYVNVEVFNSIGQKVFTIFNGFITSGSHSIKWDAENFASGIYFIKLNFIPNNSTKNFNSIKKAILTK